MTFALQGVVGEIVTRIEDKAYAIADLERIARKRLPRGVCDFIERGTEDDRAIENNRRSFDRLAFRPRVLRNVSRRTLSHTLLGSEISSPVLVAPTGVAGLVWYDGEVALARACNDAGVPFCLSTASLTPMERIGEQAAVTPWFQLYAWPDFSLTKALVQRARNAGFGVLVVTVDSAVPANREYNRRNGFSVPFRVNRRNILDLMLHPSWLLQVVARHRLVHGALTFENYPEQCRTPVTSLRQRKLKLPPNDSLTWEDFRKLRQLWRGPLVIKGVLHPEDAKLAVAEGADAIVVSNHGGRNLDCSLPPIFALRDILNETAGAVPIIVDGGIRRGSDVVKALALGASAVMVGRTPLWGLAAAGEAGARRALSLLIEEADRVMGLLGCSSAAELDASVVVDPDQLKLLADSIPPADARPARPFAV